MAWIDWLIIGVPLCIILGIALVTQQYMRSVAHFVSGGRLAGRYLLAVAKNEMQAGTVVFVALWEMFYKSGFVPFWWGNATVPVVLIFAVFGFVIYRFRETRAMTLAQFFEIRYSRRFRLFTGILGFVAGVLNFGIIPAIGARFFVYFLHLPPELTFGSFSLPTYIPLMGMFILISTIVTISGGLITLMVTDCVEGIFSQLMYVFIIFGVLLVIGWDQMGAVFGHRPAGYSIVNPFDAGQVQDFNVWYVAMSTIVGIYGTMAWQNASAYNTAALTAHESRMGGLLGRWRESGKGAIIVLMAAGAMTFLNHPDFSAASLPAHDAIAAIGNPQIREQMTVPVALSYLLPIGVKGALCAVLIMGIFGGDSTHLHSWGGILVQDVILPMRRKAPTPEEHIRLLRGCIIGVAVFAFLFGSLFRQTEYIIMWWQVTTSIYVGGAGAAIIGGLYWRKGTTAAAWVAVVTGSLLSGGGIIASKFLDKSVFPFNGMQVSFFSMLTAIALYVIVSLLTCREDYDLEAMLHRKERKPEADEPSFFRNLTWGRIIGFDENFTRGDRWIAGSLFWWSVLWCGVMVLGTLWNLVAQWQEQTWITYWHVVGIGLPIVFTVVTGIWFTWGGVKDIRALFQRLRTTTVDVADNGTVDHALPPAASLGQDEKNALLTGPLPPA